MEVSHSDLSEVSVMVLIEVGPVVVLSSSLYIHTTQHNSKPSAPQYLSKSLHPTVCSSSTTAFQLLIDEDNPTHQSTSSRMLSVLSYSTVTSGNMSSVLSCLAESGWHLFKRGKNKTRKGSRVVSELVLCCPVIDTDQRCRGYVLR